MGAGASVRDTETRVNALPDAVTKTQCVELARQVNWDGDVDAFIEDFFGDAADDASTIPKKKVLTVLRREQKKAEAAHEKDRDRRAILQKKGEETFKDALSAPDVNGLSALPKDFIDAIVPRDSAEVRPGCCLAHG
jgi:hypothetical protein